MKVQLKAEPETSHASAKEQGERGKWEETKDGTCIFLALGDLIQQSRKTWEQGYPLGHTVTLLLAGLPTGSDSPPE